VDVLPRFASSKRLRYEKQTEAPNPFRLLLVEVLHGGKVLENEEGLFDDVPFIFMDYSELPPAAGRGHSEIRISHSEFGLSSEFRIRNISQSIGDSVEGEDRKENGEAGKNGKPGSIGELVLNPLIGLANGGDDRHWNHAVRGHPVTHLLK
jgi:hypothetical protein